MMAACFALLLSSCVTNEESQSVTDIRNAKAEQLKSLAALNNAEAAAAKVLADAEAALKAAQAEAEAAKAAQIQAQIANDKLIAEAEAAMLKAEAAYQEALAAQIEEQIEKAKLEYDALKAEYAARIAQAEQAKAEADKAKAEALAELELVTINAQKALAEAKKELAEEEQLLKEKLEEIDGKNAVNLTALYGAYKDLVEDLYDAQETLVDYKKELIAAEAGLVDTKESLANLVKQNERNIELYQTEIVYVNVLLENLKKYATVDPQVAYEEAMIAMAEVNALVEDVDQADEAYKKLATEVDNLDLWYTDYYSFMDEVSMDYYDGSPVGLVQRFVTADGTAYEYGPADEAWTIWMGFMNPVKNELGGEDKVFVPVYSYYPTNVYDEDYNSPSIEYTLDGVMFPRKVEYDQISSVGTIDEKGLEAWLALRAEYFTASTESAKPMLPKAEEAVENWAAVVEAAKAWAVAQVAYDNAVKDVTDNGWYDSDRLTLLYEYNKAVDAEEDAKDAYDDAVKKVDDLKEDLAYYDTKEYLWSLEDAVEDATETDTAAKATLKAKQDALKAAQDTLVVKNAAAAKAVEALEAAKVKEREALKAWEAAKKVQAAAQKVVDDVEAAGGAPTTAQTTALTDAKKATDNAWKAYTNPSPAEGESKGAKELREAAEEALEEANQAVEDAEDDVEDAEGAVEAAQADADEAAEALVAAQTALDNLKAGKDENVLELKKQIAWAEEEVAPLKAAWEEAVKAVEEAKAAVEAVEATLPELEAPLADLKHAFDVAKKAAGWDGDEGYLPDPDDPSGLYGILVDLTVAKDALAFAEYKYEQAVDHLEMLTTAIVTDPEEQVAEDAEAITEAFEKAAVLLAAAEEQMAEYNEVSKAAAEAYIVYAEAYNAYELKNAEFQALAAVSNEATNMAQRVKALENDIADYEEQIAELEAQNAKIEAGSNQQIIDAEALVAEWTEKVEIQQTYVELLEADVAAAKAEFDAAVEAAAKAE